jgi:alcohol dehydrogenase class IV
VVARRIKDLFGDASAADLIRALNERVGIAGRLRDHGVTEEILPKLADKAIEDGCHQNNPKLCTREDLLALYRVAY